MSHPDITINGVSLEDCHTNLFALTDLSGIKWRKYVGGEGSLLGSEPLDDHVLASYTRCLRSDVLCVWRRAQKNSEHLACRKELWIFWYGDEPPSLSTLVSSHLQVDHTCEGSYESDGLNYESRILLFKALHNLIEKCLVSQGFIRVGKWFVQPFDLRHVNEKGGHLSVRFTFFLHGESTVCASIDVRLHPPLWRLQAYHLAHAANNTQNGQLPVLLAPYGLAGTITGQAYKDSDPVSQKVMNGWQEFYVLTPEPQIPPGTAANHRCPKVVEVMVGGARMRYPTAYVLVTADTQQELLRQNHGSIPPTSPPAPCLRPSNASSPPPPPSPPPKPPAAPTPMPPEPSVRLMAKAAYMDGTYQPLTAPEVALALGQMAVERLWLDAVATTGSNHSGANHGAAAASPAPPPGVNSSREGASPTDEQQVAALAAWDFGEPSQKNPCACSKHKSHKRAGSSNQSKLTLPGSKGREKGESRRMSFHRRAGLQDTMLQHEIDLLMQQPLSKAMPLKQIPSIPVTTTSSNGTPSAPAPPSISSSGAAMTTTTTPSSSSNSSSSAAGTGNADPATSTVSAANSPHSAAPSPLVALPPSGSAAHNGGDHATMPTLSPHPPPPTNGSKDNIKPEPEDGTDAKESQPQPQPAKPKVPLFRTSATPAEVSLKSEAMNTWLLSRQHNKPIKRPALPTKEYEDDDDEESMKRELYNFETLNAWLDHPVKKQKFDEEKQESEAAALRAQQQRPSSRGYRGSDSPRAGQPSTTNADGDPFEFSDESSASNLFKHTYNNRRGEENGIGDGDENCYTPVSPSTAGATATGAGFKLGLSEHELRPTMDDLNNIFDSSDSESNGGMPGPGNLSDVDCRGDQFPVPSPPKSNDKLSPPKTTIPSIPAGAVMSGPGLNELHRMYPTPPSTENNHNAASPCNGIHELPGGMMGGPDLDVTKSELTKSEPPVFRPRGLEDGGVSDWSFVYRPPPHVEFVTSLKYAAIELPSASAPPLPPAAQYRPSWLQQQQQGVGGAGQQQGQQRHHNVPAAVVTGPPQPPHPAPQPQQQPQPHTLSAQSYTNVPSVENVNSVGRPGGGNASSPYPSGGALSQQRTPRTPMSYELQSPASNASSYMNKNVNSVGAPTGTPEVHSLILNVFLSDSMVNLFKDQNFDSCPICVCNTNIKGADVGMYLTDRSAEAQYACTCGFSAVMNRKYGAAGSGLFYEDEVDITGLRDERLEQRKPSLLVAVKDVISGGPDAEKQLERLERVPPDIMLQLQCQFSSIFPSLTIKASYPSELSVLDSGNSATDGASWGISMLEKQDSCEACWQALEMGRQAVDHGLSAKLDDPVQKKNCMHPWPLLRNAPVPSNSQDVVRLLKSLQPLLQDAIQKKRTTRAWDHVYTITGPLSWKDFHLLAGRGTDETSEPQPIPAVLAGCDKDWMKVAPQSLRFWERLSLEPYASAQDVAYIVVCPDSDYLLGLARGFMAELSRQYEQCRLGKHRPLTSKFRDSTLRVGRAAARNLRNQAVADWFRALGTSPTAAKLKLYAQFCQGHLAPFIVTSLTEDLSALRTMFAEPVAGKNSKNSSLSAGEPSPAPPPTPDGGTSGGEADKENERHSSGMSSGNNDDWSAGPSSSTTTTTSPNNPSANAPHIPDLDDSELPAVVVYLVDPFSGVGPDAQVDRLAMLGLLRCYQSVLDHVRAQFARQTRHPQPNIQLQLIPINQLVSLSRDEVGGHMALRSLAMSVYSQCRRVLTHTVVGKSMTDFGPAAAATTLLNKPSENMCTELKLYTPPYIISPVQETKLSAIGEPPSQERSNVLLCGYCLSQDQRWLLAVCTDSKGELMETCNINIEIPNRNRRKKASARRIGLGKLWDFILATVTRTCTPWRLVIGRFGRIGHGELKGWSGLLSPKNLAACNRMLRETCGQCSLLGRWENPLLLSACLVSMETHSTIHVMPASVKTEEEKRSSKIQMDTPRDASCTHILVVPTSGHAQANVTGAGNLGLGNAGVDDVLDTGGDDDAADFLTGMMGDVGDAGMDDLDTMIQGGITDISDFLGFDNPDPLTSSSDHNSMQQAGSSGGAGSFGGPGGGGNGMFSRQAGAGTMPQTDPQDEVPNLQQQPLAMGFYTSTAKTGPLPKWFWAACPHRESVSPVCLKAALHVNSNAPIDPALQTPKPKTSHPLESGFTCDVLRYVLETYNALSWLNMDPETNERRSCLPIHFVVLMQLYHAIQEFV